MKVFGYTLVAMVLVSVFGMGVSVYALQTVPDREVSQSLHARVIATDLNFHSQKFNLDQYDCLLADAPVCFERSNTHTTH